MSERDPEAPSAETPAAQAGSVPAQAGTGPVPPAGEEIHIPAPTPLPLFTAVGITLTLIGITTFIELTIIGGVITIVCVVRWAMDARHELEHLPPEE